MRQIKFRGKNSKDEWVYGSLIINEAENEKGKFQVAFIVPGLPCASDGGNFYTARMERINIDTIGQFTGLLDKHGKRVFEGDILRVKEYKNLCWDLSKSREERDEMMRTFALDDLKGELEKEYVSAVAVEEGTYCLSSNEDYNDMYLSCLFGEMNGSMPIFDFEVIGNIHDDHKLLNHVVR